jgi:surface protein
MISVVESFLPLPNGNGGFSTDSRTGDTLGRILDDWMDTTKRSGIQTLYGHIGDWNVSSVQNFRYLFVGNSPIAVAFNADLSKWNVSAAQDLSGMFAGAAAFNSDLSTWDTAKVTTMFTMFRGASHFDGDVTKFNTKKCNNMQYMFKDALIFNRDLSKWKTDNVVNMGLMFDRALLFNSDLSKWQTSRVASMYKIFQNSGCKLLFSKLQHITIERNFHSLILLLPWDIQSNAVNDSSFRT